MISGQNSNLQKLTSFPYTITQNCPVQLMPHVVVWGSHIVLQKEIYWIMSVLKMKRCGRD